MTEQYFTGKWWDAWDIHGYSDNQLGGKIESEEPTVVNLYPIISDASYYFL